MVTLKLSNREAGVLMKILANVGGPPRWGREPFQARDYVERTYRKLHNAGVKPIDLHLSNSMYINWPAVPNQ